MQVVATASNGIEAVAQVTLLCPNIVVMDNSIPLLDGIKATRQILVLCPTSCVLMLSTYDTSDHIKRALDVGANGYVLKDTMGTDLLAGIHTLSGEKHYFSQKISGIAEKVLLKRK